MITFDMKMIMNSFVLLTNVFILFSMDDHRLFQSTERETINTHDKVFLNFEDPDSFLLAFRKTILDEHRLEQQIDLLHEGLLHIKEKYIQKMDTINGRAEIIINPNPNIEIIKKTVLFISHSIIAEILNGSLKSYQKDQNANRYVTHYAKEFFHFWLSIATHPHISQKDKKNIYKEIHPKVLNLNLSQGKEKITIKKSLAPQKDKHLFCC